MSRQEKGEGFPGQRIVVLPRSVAARARAHPLIAGLLPTDVGYFPRARGHLRQRTAGVDQAIFIYCAKGAGWCDIAGLRHNVRSGDLLVVPPDTPHAYGADESRPWTIHWFHLQGALVARFLAELEISATHPVTHIGHDPRLLALFEDVLETVEHGCTSAQLLYASQALGHLLAALIRAHRHGLPQFPSARQKVAQTIAFMKQRLGQPPNLGALAAVANLSRSQFVFLFKRQTGYPPIGYLTQLRMRHACHLLDTTSLSIKSVAASLGYDDPLYFSRVFHSINELSPSSYRQLRKG